MNSLFWNVNRREINDKIVEIVIENKINIIALAEYEDNKDELKRKFIENKYDIYEIESINDCRVKVFTTILPGSIERIIDKRHYTLFRINHSNMGKIMFGFVHIFSKMVKDENDYFSKMGKMVNIIESKELENNSDYTILAGDFNMNPFEKGMLASGALFSLPTIMEANKKKKILDDEEYKMFYNPMWKFCASGRAEEVKKVARDDDE